jgi:hypothetical protein
MSTNEPVRVSAIELNVTEYDGQVQLSIFGHGLFTLDASACVKLRRDLVTSIRHAEKVSELMGRIADLKANLRGWRHDRR